MRFFLALSLAEQVMFGLVVLLGLFAGWRNATAGALVVCYCIVMGAWWKWGITFPKPIGLLLDVGVLLAMYCKQPVYYCVSYDTFGQQLCSIWLERSYWDRTIIALFGAAWLVYVAPISDDARWWPLWIIAVAQYLAAGGETLQAFQFTRAAKRASTSGTPSSGLEFKAGWRDWSYG